MFVKINSKYIKPITKISAVNAVWGPNGPRNAVLGLIRKVLPESLTFYLKCNNSIWPSCIHDLFSLILDFDIYYNFQLDCVAIWSEKVVVTTLWQKVETWAFFPFLLSIDKGKPFDACTGRLLQGRLRSKIIHSTHSTSTLLCSTSKMDSPDWFNILLSECSGNLKGCCEIK